MSNEKELLFSLLTKAYNKTEAEITPLLYDTSETGETTLKTDANEQLLSLDANRVNSWKTKQGEVITKAVGEATAKTHGYWENNLKTKFAIDADVRGEELLIEVENRMKQVSAGDGKGKNSKEYLELEAQKRTLENELKTNYVPLKEYEKLTFNIEKDKRLSVADNVAMTTLNNLKLLGHEDTIIQSNLTEAFRNKLASKFDDIEITEDKKVFPLKGGQRIENNNGYAVELQEIVKEIALGYWREVKQPATGNGDGNKSQSQSSASIAEMERKLNDPATSPEERYSLLLLIQKQKQQ
jgi:hypothetical protein